MMLSIFYPLVGAFFISLALLIPSVDSLGRIRPTPWLAIKLVMAAGLILSLINYGWQYALCNYLYP